MRSVKTTANERKKVAPAKRAAATAKKTAKIAKPERAASPVKKTARKVPAKAVPRRSDYGAPVEGFFAKQPAELGAILSTLRELILEAAPEATATLKWGMPFYTVREEMMCAVAGFKSHVNLILPGAAGTYADPDGLLEGDGKTGRHLKLRTPEDLPRRTVRGWLRTAAANARKKSRS